MSVPFVDRTARMPLALAMWATSKRSPLSSGFAAGEQKHGNTEFCKVRLRRLLLRMWLTRLGRVCFRIWSNSVRSGGCIVEWYSRRQQASDARRRRTAGDPLSPGCRTKVWKCLSNFSCLPQIIRRNFGKGSRARAGASSFEISCAV